MPVARDGFRHGVEAHEVGVGGVVDQSRLDGEAGQEAVEPREPLGVAMADDEIAEGEEAAGDADLAVVRRDSGAASRRVPLAPRFRGETV